MSVAFTILLIIDWDLGAVYLILRFSRLFDKQKGHRPWGPVATVY